MDIDSFRDRLFRSLIEKLRGAREQRGYTQGDVATELELKRASIANFETGRQRLPVDVLYRYAHFVGIGVQELFPSWDEIAADDVVDTLELEAGEFLQKTLEAP